ncbi:hypothetical protein TNCV_3355921 [Trichonephila clavipes]|nr:hypothetical protein TNCV_3355921 [Trichonephila clavipes]
MVRVLESTFELAVPKPITEERTKYNYCVAHLFPDVAMAVRDVILSPGSINSYSKLKDEVIARCGESKSQEIRQLLAVEQLGDRKPSELFRQLPPNAQSILASIQPLTAQKVSDVADRILEVTPVQVSAVSKYSSANSDDSSESKLLKELKLLRQEVKELRRSRSFSRNRFDSRNRGKSPKPKASNLCCTFQRFIDEVTRGLKGVYAFIDDILIASQNVQEHTTYLRALFERLDYYGLTIKPSKCTFGVDSLKFLGFQVSSEGISPLPDRVDAIQKFSRPNTLTQLQGHINKKKPCRPSKSPQTPLEWTEEAENSFTAAKTALADTTLLKHPIPGATLSVWTDASNFAIGSSLMQLSNSNWEPTAFLSLKLSKTQQNWSTYDRELLAIYTSIKKFRHMLEGREFIIYTDQEQLFLPKTFWQKPLLVHF